jgi:hypothetical protein
MTQGGTFEEVGGIELLLDSEERILSSVVVIQEPIALFNASQMQNIINLN